MSAMNGTRTRAWWLVRIEFLIGLGLALLIGRLGYQVAMTFSVGNPPVHALPLPPNAMLFLGTLAIAIFGLAWMVLIIRGPGDDPPACWRYRDRPQYHRRADG
jgi:hypothetical protein